MRQLPIDFWSQRQTEAVHTSPHSTGKFPCVSSSQCQPSALNTTGRPPQPIFRHRWKHLGYHGYRPYDIFGASQLGLKFSLQCRRRLRVEAERFLRRLVRKIVADRVHTAWTLWKSFWPNVRRHLAHLRAASPGIVSQHITHQARIHTFCCHHRLRCHVHITYHIIAIRSQVILTMTMSKMTRDNDTTILCSLRCLQQRPRYRQLHPPSRRALSRPLHYGCRCAAKLVKDACSAGSINIELASQGRFPVNVIVIRCRWVWSCPFIYRVSLRRGCGPDIGGMWDYTRGPKLIPFLIGGTVKFLQ